MGAVFVAVALMALTVLSIIAEFNLAFNLVVLMFVATVCLVLAERA